MKASHASRSCGGSEAAVQHIECAGHYGISHLKPANFAGSTGSNPIGGVVLGLATACLCAGALMYLKLKGK